MGKKKSTEAYPAAVLAMMSDNSALLLKAHTFAEMGLPEVASPLWVAAAGHAERLAPLLEGLGHDLEAAVQRISAGSCYQKAGELSRAVNLYRAALSGPLREDTSREVSQMLDECLTKLTGSLLGEPQGRKLRKIATDV